MMCYLAIVAEEIRSSKDNRLVLDDIYTSLINDINPRAVDENTQEHLQNLLDIIKSYRKLTLKRERLQFIYNQEKAAAMRNAIPSQLTVHAMSSALDWKRLAISVAYGVVDSYRNYKNATQNADKNFIMNAWDLDDQEMEAVQKPRERSFNYMIDMVRDYGLDGKKTLNEKAVCNFVEICSIESLPEKISRLEMEAETYQILGDYWLELANCYFENEQYDKCLQCVDKYNDLSTGIYRKDYNLARILPKAIVAAQKQYPESKYIPVAKKYADMLDANTDDWSSNYFIAQINLDLYDKTHDKAYLQAAYEKAHSNVTLLLKDQRALNDTYLADVKEITVDEPDYRYLSKEEKKEKQKEFKEEQKRAKEYNKSLKEARVTELPTLYEPLVLNCELLRTVASELKIDDTKKTEINNLLEADSNGIFMNKLVNEFYTYRNADKSHHVIYSQDQLRIPVCLLTAGTKVVVTVTENENVETVEDYTIQTVERKKDQAFDEFTAVYTSMQLMDHKWSADSKVEIKLIYEDANNRSATFACKVVKYVPHFYGEEVVFG